MIYVDYLQHTVDFNYPKILGKLKSKFTFGEKHLEDRMITFVHGLR